MKQRKPKWIVWYKHDSINDLHEFQDSVHCDSVFEAVYLYLKLRILYTARFICIDKPSGFKVKLYRI